MLQEARNFYIGSNIVSRLYMGEVLVWPSPSGNLWQFFDNPSCKVLNNFRVTYTNGSIFVDWGDGVGNQIISDTNYNHTFQPCESSSSSSSFSLSNLLLYWNFENESITPTFQASSYTVDQAGTPSYINDGPSNQKAVRLTPNSRINLRNNLWNFPSSPSSFSVSFWIRKNATNSTGQQAVYLGSCFGNMGFYFSENGGDFLLAGETDTINNNLCFSLLKGNTAPFYLRVRQDVAPPINEWFHVCGTYDLNTKIAKLYKNGVEVASQDLSAHTLSFRNDNWNGITLNGSVVSTSSSEYGNNYDFAFVSLWNRVLTDEEILLAYNNPTVLN